MSSEYSFWKNIILIVVFFTVTPITLGITMFSLLSFKPDINSHVLGTSTGRSGAKVYASLPDEFPTVNGIAVSQDARPEIVKQYLSSYESSLVNYSEFIVVMADKYGIDYRLIPAIAQQESNLCKHIPPDGFNCWGWGIHSRGTLDFDSFEHGIETVSEGLKSEYLDKGFVTPEEIMSKYTPLSNGSWAAGVRQFMSEMQ